jgi:DNA-binding transcriptional ArsR family regulator
MRLKLLQLLEPGEHSVGQLVDLVGGNQPNVSRHLQVLHEGGLVARRRDGGNVFYSIADPVVFELCDLVCRSAAQQARALASLTEDSLPEH